MEKYRVEAYKMSDEEKTEFVDLYEQFYFYETQEKKYSEDEKGVLGNIIKNKTDEKIKEFADKILNSQRLDKRIFLWKAGRLDIAQAACDDENKIKEFTIVNGRGKKIEGADEFIDNVNKEWKTTGTFESFETDYNKLLEIAKKSKLKNVGSVYLITVLFFLSNKKYPIYDYFAHKAVKSLYLDKIPADVFVGSAPEKTELRKVCAMYTEYLDLLEQVFGCSIIDRQLDRSLWVYGHASEKWSPLGK